MLFINEVFINNAMNSIFHNTFINNIVLPDLAKYVVYDFVKHHNKGIFIDSVIAIIEDTAASASCRSMVIAGNPGTVSTIQVRKFAFKFLCM